jgi:hypothetical protein
MGYSTHTQQNTIIIKCIADYNFSQDQWAMLTLHIIAVLCLLSLSFYNMKKLALKPSSCMGDSTPIQQIIVIILYIGDYRYPQAEWGMLLQHSRLQISLTFLFYFKNSSSFLTLFTAESVTVGAQN